MFKKIENSLMYARFTQLLCVYLAAVILYRFTTIPHARWVYTTTVVLLASNNPGLIYQKSFMRGIGTIYGLVLFIPLVYLMQINYKLIGVALFFFAVLHNSTPAKRNDITVMFMTLMVFTMNSFSEFYSQFEGPFEVLIKRFICVLLAICLCLIGDYLFFSRYQYSKKLYMMYQRKVCYMLQKQVSNIINNNDLKVNRVILIDQIRAKMNQVFLDLSNSADGLYNEYKTLDATKKTIKDFDCLVWQLRRLVFSIYYAKFVLKEQESTKKHKIEFNQIYAKAKTNFIYR